MQKIKVFFYNNKSWIYTLQYIFISFLLLIFVSLVDLRILPFLDYLPDVMKLQLGFSQSILTTLAAAFLTITTFTFSTILTVLNTYASSYTPRIVENFVNMKITLKVIGIFMGGFFYCIGSLIFAREVFDNELVISGFVAILYSIISIFYFIVFVQRVITKFQGVNIILDVANIAEAVIETEIKLRKESPDFGTSKEYASIEIKAVSSGYLSMVDLDAICSMMAESKGFLRIDAKIGEYISENSVIGKLQIEQGLEEDDIEKMESYFVFQDNKIESSDYRYNIEKLLEIALRAISPGINDPNTAIHCIHKIGYLLKKFSEVDAYHIQKAANRDFRIYYSSYSFKEDIEMFYMPLIHYCREDLQVILAILKSLIASYSLATEKNRGHIVRLVRHLEEKAAGAFDTELEQELFRSALSFFIS